MRQGSGSEEVKAPRKRKPPSEWTENQSGVLRKHENGSVIYYYLFLDCF